MKNTIKLRARQTLKQKLRLNAFACTFAIGFVAFITWFYFQTKPEKAFAASLFYSMSDGEWKSDIWSKNGSTACSCDPSCNYNGPGVNISHKLTSSTCSPLNLSGGGILNINSGGKLVVTTDMVLSGTSYINVYLNDTLIVKGNITISGGSVINNQGGYVRIDGNVNLTGGSSYNCSGGTSTYGGAITFSGGSAWNSCSPTFLPIKLIYFKTAVATNGILLSWATASEENNDYFSIESSNDAKIFNEVYKMHGAGNSSTTLKYSFIDKSQQAGIIYYRLKQTDYNGQFTYSDIEAINYRNSEIAVSEKLMLKSISPNPFTERFELSFNINNKKFIGKDAHIKLISVTGHTIFNDVLIIKEGKNNYQFIDKYNLTKGLYYLNLYCEGESDTKQIIKE